MRAWIARIAVAVAMAALALLGGLIVCGALGIAIPVGPLRGTLERTLSESLGRPVTIARLGVVPRLRPTLRVARVVVASPPGYARPFLTLARAEASVRLLPLLSGDLSIGRATVSGLSLALLERDGEDNHRFGDPRPSDGPEDPSLGLPPITVDALRLQAFEFLLADEDGAIVSLRLDEARASADATGLALEGDGAYADIPAHVDLTGGTLDALLGGRSPWPIAGSGRWGEVDLVVDGQISGLPKSFDGYQTRLDASGERLDQLGALFGVDLPGGGPFRASTQLAVDGRHLLLGALEAEVADARGGADLELAFGERPALRGQVSIERLEPGDLIGPARADADPDAPFSVPLEALRSLDVDLEISAAHLSGWGAEISAASGRFELDGAGLRARLDGTLPGGAARAKLSLGLEGPVAWNLHAELATLDAAGLLADLAIEPGAAVTGGLEALAFDVTARGRSEDELRRTLAGTLRARSGTFDVASQDRALAVRVRDLAVSLPESGSARTTARVALLDRDLRFAATIASLPRLLAGESSRLDASLEGDGARIAVGGQVSTQPVRLDLVSNVTGDRLGDLAPWIGSREDAETPLSAEVRVQLAEGDWRFDLVEARVGTTVLRGRIKNAHTPVERALADASGPTAEPRAEPLHGADLGALFGADSDGALRLGDDQLVLDAPVLLAPFVTDDAEFELFVASIASQPEIEDLRLSLTLGANGVVNGNLAFELGESALEGRLVIDLVGTDPRVELEISGEQVDIGLILAVTGVAQDRRITAERVDISFAGYGHEPKQLMETGVLDARLTNVEHHPFDPNSGAEALVRYEHVAVTSERGGPLRAQATGTTAERDVEVRIETGTLAQLFSGEGEVPFEGHVSTGGLRFDLSARGGLPLEQSAINADARIEGDRLDELGKLFDLALPPVGPFAFTGRLEATGAGYRFRDLVLSVGESRLEGELQLDTQQHPPRLEGRIHGPLLRAEDLRLEDWVFRPPGDEPKDRSKSLVEAAESTPAPLLSPESLGQLNAALSIEVGELRSLDDRLGRGSAQLRLEGGRLAIAPAEVDFPGGHASLAWFFTAGAEEDVSEIVLAIRGFDYGIIARYLDPETEARGRASVDVNLTARAPAGAPLLGRSNGRLDIAVWPEDMRAEVVDFWAVSLLLAVLPALEIRQSTVNCMVARMDVLDGVARQELVVLDTTAVRVVGDGMVDFRNDRIDFTLRPHPKVSQIYNLATPLAIHGQLSDFRAGVSPQHLLGTVFRFVTSPGTAPLGWLLNRNPPRDGSDVCTTPMRFDQPLPDLGPDRQ